jgi:hypothetical protein
MLPELLPPVVISERLGLEAPIDCLSELRPSFFTNKATPLNSRCIVEDRS